MHIQNRSDGLSTCGVLSLNSDILVKILNLYLDIDSIGDKGSNWAEAAIEEKKKNTY